MTYEQWIKEISSTTYLVEHETKPKVLGSKLTDLFYQSPEEDEAEKEA